MRKECIISILIMFTFLSSCATKKPEIIIVSSALRNTNDSITVKATGQQILDNLFAIQIYIYNQTPAKIDLNLDNIILIDNNAVVLNKLSSDEAAKVVITNVGRNEFVDPAQYKLVAEQVALKNCSITPGTAAMGKLFWFKYFEYPVYLHIVIGDDAYQFQFMPR